MIICAAYLVSTVLATMAINAWTPFSEAVFFPTMAAISFAAGLAWRRLWALLLPLGLASVYLIVVSALIAGGPSSERYLPNAIVLGFAIVFALWSEAGVVAGMVAARVLDRLRGRHQTDD